MCAQIREQLTACEGQLDKARGEAYELRTQRTVSQRCGPAMFFMGAMALVIAGMLMFNGIWPETRVVTHTIERSCSVEHAVDAVVQEAVRRALYEEAQRAHSDL